MNNEWINYSKAVLAEQILDEIDRMLQRVKGKTYKFTKEEKHKYKILQKELNRCYGEEA